jgi:hypothetical protein
MSSNKKKKHFSRGDYFRFGLVFIKKSNQTGFFFKNQNQFKPIGFGSVILEQKPVQTGFSGLARFFSGLGLVRFFRFQTYKTKTEPVGFVKILIGLIDFFYSSIFLVICFLIFLI